MRATRPARLVPFLLLALVAPGAWASWPPWWDYTEAPILHEWSAQSGMVAHLRLVSDGSPYAVEIAAHEMQRGSALAMVGYRDGEPVAGGEWFTDHTADVTVSTWGETRVATSPPAWGWDVVMALVSDPPIPGEYTLVAWTAGEVGPHTIRIYATQADLLVDSALGDRTLVASSRTFDNAAGVHAGAGDRSVRAQLLGAQEFEVQDTLVGAFASRQAPPDDRSVDRLRVVRPDGEEWCERACYFDLGSPSGQYRFEATGAGARTWRNAGVYVMLADVPPLGAPLA